MFNAKDFLTQAGRQALVTAAIRGGKKVIVEAGKLVPAHEEKPSVGTVDLGFLSSYTKNLTKLAAEGKLDPVIGREAEINNIIQILERRSKNNALVVGETGVGKTALINLLALKISSGDVPDALRGVSLLSLEANKLLSGTKMRADIETRLSKILDQANLLSDKVVLFIDNLEDIVNDDSSESVAMILKTSLNRSISVTNTDCFRTKFEKDTSFTRRFQVVNVEPSSVKETVEILKGLSEKINDFYGVTLSEDSIKSAASLADRYVQGRFLPDKAIDLVEAAAAMLKLEIQADATTPQDITENHIATIIQKWTGIPAAKMLEGEKEKLAGIETTLNSRVIGQSKAVASIASAIKRSRSGIGDPRKPIGSFLFLGPTGVGKTELARAVAEFLFEDANAMHRFDMSEYGEKHMVARMLGAPVGYAGHDQGGQLTDPIRKNPYSVVLFDEIEKAHPDVWNIFLQILDEGRLTDNMGRVVDFRNTIVIMTSNIGARHCLEDSPESEIKDRVMDEVKKNLRPELLNRIDDVVVFNKLNKVGIRKIVELQLRSFVRRFDDKRIVVNVTDAAKDWLADVGYDPAFGARPLKRAITNNLESRLAQDLVDSLYVSGDVICVDCQDARLTFSKLAT